jgi:vacuolar-type H+-ATPase subunit H
MIIARRQITAARKEVDRQIAAADEQADRQIDEARAQVRGGLSEILCVGP